MKSYKITPDTAVGEIVTENFRTAQIFKNVGIDFCCGGKGSLKDACTSSGNDLNIIMTELQDKMNSGIGEGRNFKDWDLGFLCDYICNSHHKFVLKNLPELAFYTQKVANVHGSQHAELIEVADLFAKINTELLEHLKKEEENLFPAIKSVLKNNDSASREIIKHEIERMSDEHEFAGGAMDHINVLTSNYRIPEDACNTYKVCLQLLSQFEDDLHIHVHLENNILYPKALLL